MKTKLYHYTESGLSNVWLANGFEMQKTEYGKGVAIANVKGLHSGIAKHLVDNKPRLSGNEFRFLRKELGLSQAKLAKLWGYDVQTIALWEKGNRIPIIADRFIRAYYREVSEGNAHIVKMIERLNDMDLREDKRLVFEETKSGWQTKAA